MPKLQFYGLRSIQHLKKIKEYDEWETPKLMFEDACKKYNVKPVLDVCATEKNHKCDKYLTIDWDGLGQQWKEDFFMNPPYSWVDRWVKHAYYQHSLYNVTGMALIYSKTDTRWWHEYIQDLAEVYFIKGRIKFQINGRPSKNSAPYPSCWVVWRKKPQVSEIT